MNYRVPSDKSIKIYLSFTGSKGRTRECELTRIRGEYLFAKPCRNGSSEDYLCVCIRKALESLGFKEAFEGRDEDFKVKIFIKVFKEDPYILHLSNMKDNLKNAFEKIYGKVVDIIYDEIPKSYYL